MGHAMRDANSRNYALCILSLISCEHMLLRISLSRIIFRNKTDLFIAVSREETQ